MCWEVVTAKEFWVLGYQRTDESRAKRGPTPLAKCQVAFSSLYVNIKLCHPVILPHNDGKAGSGDHLLPTVLNLLQPQRDVAVRFSLLLSGCTQHYSEVPLPCGQAGRKVSLVSCHYLLCNCSFFSNVYHSK